MKVDWGELKRLQGEAKASVNRRGVSWTVMPSTQEMAEFYFHLSDAFPAILAEREAAQRSMTLLTQSRDRCIAENTRLAKRVAELDPANCHPMRLNAAFDKETQNEG